MKVKRFYYYTEFSLRIYPKCHSGIMWYFEEFYMILFDFKCITIKYKNVWLNFTKIYNKISIIFKYISNLWFFMIVLNKMYVK